MPTILPNQSGVVTPRNATICDLTGLIKDTGFPPRIHVEPRAGPVVWLTSGLAQETLARGAYYVFLC